jgi:hypothetical protein
MKFKIGAILILALLFGSYSGFSSSASNTTGFKVINVQWGTASTPVAAAPGDRNIPLTVTLQYTFANTATGIQGLLGLPSGFSLYNGSNIAFSSASGLFPSGSIIQLTFQMYLASNLTLGAYTFPLNITWSASGYAYVLNQTSDVTAYILGRPGLYFSTQSQALTPGELNTVPLTIYNNGTGPATSVSLTITSQMVGILNSLPTIQEIDAGANSQESLQIFVPLALAGSVVPLSVSSSYKDPYGNTGSTVQVVDLYTSAQSQARLTFAASNQTLIPGRTNNLTITVTNSGTLSLSQLSTSITSQSQLVTVLGSFPYLASLAPGSFVNSEIGIYVAPGAANSPVSITLTANFVQTSSGSTGSISQTLGFYATNFKSPLSNITISVVPVNTSVTAGREGQVDFLVRNAGNESAYSPILSLAVASPLAVVANSSFSYPSFVIQPGASLLYEAILTASPSSTPGIYSGTLSATYSDKQGDQTTQPFSVGIRLVGEIDLVITGQQISESGGNLSISGTILNEGTTSAYYSEIWGKANLGSGPQSYLGEIDANTPLPFSITVPAQLSTSSQTTTNLTIFITYQDNFGTPLQSSFSNSVTLSPSQNSTNTTTAKVGARVGGLFLILIAVIVILAVIIAVVALRRRRPPKEEQSKVI